MITVGITGSSRPDLFSKTWQSFEKMVHMRKEFDVVYHEDFIFENESKKSVEYARSNIKNVEIITHNPKCGFGKSIDIVFRKIKTKYMFYLQDDWEFELPVDLDRLIWVMDRNPKINQIMFFKRNVTKFLELNGKILLPDEQKQCTFDGVDLCLTNLKWTFIPSIWRMDYARRYWKLYKDKPEPKFKKSLTGSAEEIGCYMFGRHGDYRTVKHLGEDCAMEKMVDGKPVKCEVDNSGGKAPWV